MGAHKVSTIREKTDELFMCASHSDDDLGYPADVEFVPADEDWADEVVWHNLTEGQATVLVGEEFELLLTPLRRGPLDRLSRRVPVNVSRRVHGHATPYATSSRIGRHPVRQMRRLAHA
jgi:hypothetical protein